MKGNNIYEEVFGSWAYRKILTFWVISRIKEYDNGTKGVQKHTWQGEEGDQLAIVQVTILKSESLLENETHKTLENLRWKWIIKSW